MIILKNLLIYSGFFAMIILAFGLIIDDKSVPQKNVEIELEIKDKVNICKKQDNEELLISF